MKKERGRGRSSIFPVCRFSVRIKFDCALDVIPEMRQLDFVLSKFDQGILAELQAQASLLWHAFGFGHALPVVIDKQQRQPQQGEQRERLLNPSRSFSKTLDSVSSHQLKLGASRRVASHTVTRNPSPLERSTRVKIAGASVSTRFVPFCFMILVHSSSR